MTPERWQQMKRVFDLALARPPAERGLFLDEALPDHDSLRHEVEGLLASNSDAANFLETPAAAEVARLIVDENAFSAGERIANYEIVAALGAGGMGEVYRAHDPKLDRDVAIKVLPRLAVSDADLLERFGREALTTSGLNHPNILTVYEFGQLDYQPFIVTEYVHGITLRQRLQKSRLHLRDALGVAIQIAAALAAAHKSGVIHRDIKPENVMIRHDGVVKVLDFGLAKAPPKHRPKVALDADTAIRVQTSPGVVMGTANYMSPEQARGLDVDERTDIWSLGVVLYEMISGRAPFQGETTADVIAMILQQTPEPLRVAAPETDQQLNQIIEKALARDRAVRYRAAKDMLLDLKRVKHHLDFVSELDRTPARDLRSDENQIRVPAPANAESASQTSFARAVATRASSAEYIITEIKRHRTAVVTAVAVALAVLILGVASYWWYSRGRPPALTEKDTVLLADFENSTGDPVFDGTLKQALAIQLEQSPFLSIFPDARIRETLRYMGRSPDERVTNEIAREICEREGLKALLTGSIASLGSHYVITLTAFNGRTGEVIAREQAEAQSKEQVIGCIGDAATKLRAKLGESLASIQKFDVLAEHATTPSLDALKAYALGRELIPQGKWTEAVPLFKRATELDPNFARAYDLLAVAYVRSGAPEELAFAAAQKAFDLRERSSEYEKLKIAADYYRIATGEIEKAIDALQSLTLMYPRDYIALGDLAGSHIDIGQYEKAVAEYREALRLNPKSADFNFGLAMALRCLNRFDEAKQVCEEALTKFDLPSFHIELHRIALVQGDAGATQRELEILAQAAPDSMTSLQAGSAWYFGQALKGRELWNRRADSAIGNNRKDLAADVIASNAWRDAVFGDCRQALAARERASALPRNAHSFLRFGLVEAFCGNPNRAESIATETAKHYPKDTFINALQVPILRAAIAMRRNNPAQAIEVLRSTMRFDGSGAGYSVAYWPAYLRGQAYLDQRQGPEASAEFHRILDHRGLVPHEVLYPLAYLGLARASALTGDTAKARKAYQDFFAVWKDADQDIPVLVAAKREYEGLK